MLRVQQGLLALGLILMFMGPARACTGITVRAGDGSVIFARTLEFAVDLESDVVVIPRGNPHTGTTASGAPGLKWKSRYGVVGMNAFGMPITVNGLNEEGLSVGLFYFPGYATYQAADPAESAKALAPWELGTYLLGTCRNVDEALSATRGVRVEAVVQAQMGIVPPVHYIVTDSTGRSIVIEYLDGQLRTFDNPLGVLTNSPSFDWHMTNLGNYVNLSVTNVPQVDVDGVTVKGLGQGSGLLGIPGDFTPPSRFVRAVIFSGSALPVKTGREAVLQAFHILNQFDIPKGAARGTENGQVVSDYTLWTAASDQTQRRYYFRTYGNSRIRMIDLQRIDFSLKEIRTIPLTGEEEIQDLTPSRN